MAMSPAAAFVSSDFAAELHQHAQISFSGQSICKFDFPTLETVADYHNWITDVRNQMRGDSIHDVVWDLVQKHDHYVWQLPQRSARWPSNRSPYVLRPAGRDEETLSGFARHDAPTPDVATRPPYVGPGPAPVGVAALAAIPMVDTPTHDAADVTTWNSTLMSHYRNTYQRALASIKGRAKVLLQQVEVRSLVDVIAQMEACFGTDRTNAKANMMTEFNSKCYDPKKERFSDWCTRKLWILANCEEEVAHGRHHNAVMMRILTTLMPESWFDFLTLVRGQNFVRYEPMMQMLKDHDERKNPERVETAGVSYSAETPNVRNAVTKKDGKGTGGASILKDMIARGDYTGMTTANLNAYLTDHARKITQKANAKTSAVYNAKGGKGSGKGTFQPRDRSKDTCNNCDKKGHWAPDCPEERRTTQSNHRPVSSSYTAKGGKGKGKGKGGKFKRNQVKGSAPY